MLGKGVIRQMVASVIVTVGAITIGTTIGWSMARLELKEIRFSALVIVVLGMIGAIIAGKIMNLIGHRYGLVLSQLIVIIGLGLTCPERVSDEVFTIGVALQALGAGAISTIVPAYVGEISQPNIRGGQGALFHVLLVIGILYTYVLISYLRDRHLVVTVMCGVWSMVHVVGVCFVPESPYFLLKTRDETTAVTSMTKLRDDETTAEIQQEVSAIKNEIENRPTSVKGTFTDRANTKAMVIGFCLMTVLVVINVKFIMIHIVKLCKDDCFGKIRPELMPLIFLVLQLFVLMVVSVIIDVVGRRVLLVISGTIMFFSSIGLFCCFQVINFVCNFNVVVIGLIIIHICAFTVGFGPVPWVIIGEIFPINIKGFGIGSIVATYWLDLTFITKPLESNRNLFFLINAAVLFLGTLFVWILVPETKNKYLAEIKEMLAAKEDLPSIGVV